MDVALEVFWAVHYLMVRGALAALPLCAVVWLVTYLGRRWLVPRVRYLLWSLVLLRMVLPFGVAGPVGLNQATWVVLVSLQELGGDRQTASDRDVSFWRAGSPETAADPALASNLTTEIAFRPNERPVESVIDWEDVVWVLLPVALWCGALVVAVGMIVSTVRLRRRVANGTEFTDASAREILDNGRRLFGVRGEVQLTIVPGLSGPAAYGVWQPAILLPEEASGWSTTEMRHVVWHELVHIARRDVAANLVVSVVRVLQWWNPLFWWVQRNWLAEREGACDARVVSRLSGEAPSAYGHTILSFVERMRGGPVAAPGFVGFLDTFRKLGRDRSLRQRLEQLSRASQPENWKSRLFTGGLVLGLVVVGWTDASAVEEAGKTPVVFELPEGAEWVVQPAATKHESELVPVTYVVSATLERLRKDEPEVEAPILKDLLVQDVRGLLGLERDGRPKAGTGDVPTCQPFEETKLVVRATNAQHDRVARFLASIAKHGMRQVLFEMRVVATRVSLADLPGSGQIVVGAEDWSGAKLAGVTSGDRHDGRVPVYMHRLDPAATTAFLTKLEADRDSNMMSAPRVTVIEGQAATVQVGVQRAFVTALKSTKSEPVVSIIETGLEIELDSQPGVDDDAAIQLGVAYQRSDVVDVEVLTTRVAGRDSSIQMPRLVRSVFRGKAEFADGHTLLFAPLRRDASGRMELCLVTGRRVAIKK
jgi:bla regulator protein blaR1